MNKITGLVIIAALVIIGIVLISNIMIYSVENLNESDKENMGQDLTSRHTELLEELKIQTQNHSDGKTNREQYLQEVQKLRDAELDLFDDVENYEFADNEVDEHTYFYRSVMKFPGEIERTLNDPEYRTMP